MHLVKTAELEPNQNYVMGFHPHGIISMSAFVTFATEALDVSKKYPGDACCPFLYLALSTCWHALKCSSCRVPEPKPGAGHARDHIPPADPGAELLCALCAQLDARARHLRLRQADLPQPADAVRTARSSSACSGSCVQHEADHSLCVPYRGKGKAIMLCVGGAREALLAEPDTFEIVLGKRTVCPYHLCTPGVQVACSLTTAPW